MSDSQVMTAIKERVSTQVEANVAAEKAIAEQGPSTRWHYVQECKRNIKSFKESCPFYWIEYIRSNNRPDDYFGLMELKSWLRDKDTLGHNDDVRDQLIHKLVDEKLKQIFLLPSIQ